MIALWISLVIGAAHADAMWEGVADLVQYPGLEAKEYGRVTLTAGDNGGVLFLGTINRWTHVCSDDGEHGCGIHLHEGFSCDQQSGSLYVSPGNHFMTTRGDDPFSGLTIGNTTSSTEKTEINVTSAPLDIKWVFGRTVVLHDSGGVRVACGVVRVNVISEDVLFGQVTPYPSYTTGQANLTRYPGYDGPYNVIGTVDVTFDVLDSPAAAGQYSYNLSGVPPESAGGVHVHVGRSCEIESEIGGHYYTSNPDPWTTTYASANDDGRTHGTFQVADGFGADDHVSHTVVVHEQGGPRAGCGTLTYAPRVVGSVLVHQTNVPDVIVLTVQLIGLERRSTKTTGTFHVHAGCSCEDAGGHLLSYSRPEQPDPWGSAQFYEVNKDFSSADVGKNGTAAAQGFSLANATVHGFTLADICGHAVVVHASNGDRIGCAVIDTVPTCAASCTPTPTPSSPPPLPHSAEVDMGAYPGTSYPISGTLEVEETPTGLRIFGDVHNLPAECADGCGIHVHDGFSCDTNYVGGHFTLGPQEKDPWGGLEYNSPSFTAAVDITSVDPSVTLGHVLGRVVVMHGEDSTLRVACGQIALRSTSSDLEFLVVNLGKYPGYDADPESGEMSRGGVAKMAKIVGYDSDYTYEGTVTVWANKDNDRELSYRYALEGFPPVTNPNASLPVNTSAREIHVFAERTCPYLRTVPCDTPGDCPTELVDHLDKSWFNNEHFSETPWKGNMFTPANDVGVSNGEFTMDDGWNSDAHASHVVVTHDENGARAACGELVYTPRAQGFVMISNATPGSITLTANLAGLERPDGAVDGSGQIHIHSGCTCGDAANVSGHLWSYSIYRDPWTPGNQFYTTEPYWAREVTMPTLPKGIDNLVSVTVEGYDLEDIMGHAVVLHASDNSRVACGIIECVGDACEKYGPRPCTPTPAPPSYSPPLPDPAPSPEGVVTPPGGDDDGLSDGSIAAAVIVPMFALAACFVGLRFASQRKGVQKMGASFRAKINI